MTCEGGAVSLPIDLRSAIRIPIRHRVKVVPRGRTAALAVAANVSLGGMLLGAAGPPLPVGTRCEVAILVPGAALDQAVRAAGTVVRTDAQGTAIRFARSLQSEAFQAMVRPGVPWLDLPLVRAYVDYFQVSQSRDGTNCEALLGVSLGTLRKVFLATFSVCILAAILPVWLYRTAIPAMPAWEKVAFSFAYGLAWLGLVQPSVDLAVLGILRSRRPKGTST
jgi:PilZ domain